MRLRTREVPPNKPYRFTKDGILKHDQEFWPDFTLPTVIQRIQAMEKLSEDWIGAIDLQREVADRMYKWQLSEFVRLHLWNYFVTLTFELEQSHPSAQRGFCKWVRHLERRNGNGVAWFLATEGDNTERVHVHALLEGDLAMTETDIEVDWRPGRADVRIYDPTRGAAAYMTKRIGTDRGDYDISKRRWKLAEA